MTGRLVYSEKGCQCLDQEIGINLKSGMYFVGIYGASETTTFKVILK